MPALSGLPAAWSYLVWVSTVLIQNEIWMWNGLGPDLNLDRYKTLDADCGSETHVV